jgi:signal transduction histidine kinase
VDAAKDLVEATAQLSELELGVESIFDDAETGAAVDDTERRLRRLAFDIHDGPMQSLTAAGFGLQAVQHRLEPGRDDLIAELNQIVADLAAAESTLRTLITTLGDRGTLHIESIHAICAREVERFRAGCPARIELLVTPDAYPDSHSQEIAISAVVREALANVAKHARAAAVKVRVDADRFGIRLTVEDDGEGFDPTDVRDDRIGLVSMRSRLEFLGGDLAIESRPGGPTIVSATLPRWQA